MLYYSRFVVFLLRPLLEGITLLLHVLLAVGVVAVAHLSQTVLPSSIWLGLTVQTVEASLLVSAVLVSAAVVLRSYGLFLSEWRRTSRQHHRR